MVGIVTDGCSANAEPVSGRGRSSRRYRGLILAVLISAATVGVQFVRYQDSYERYNRFFLPGFDAYVYMAMAEHPTFFSVAPWGYRVLTPWLVALLPLDNPIIGYHCTTLGGLVAAGALLFLFLRRLGHGEWASLAAVAVFGLSPPVATAVENLFLTEPLTVGLEIAFLLTLEAGAGLPALAILAALGTLSKEVFLVFLPAVYFARLETARRLPALAKALAAAIPALVAVLLLRVYWAPHLGSGLSLPGLGLVKQALGTVASEWSVWWKDMLLIGLVPLACVGALRQKSRTFLRRYGCLLIPVFALPLFASVYTQSDTVSFFAQDIPRLLIYALPIVLPLCLTAMDRIWPSFNPSHHRNVVKRKLQSLGVAAVAGLAALPVLLTDPYTRRDLRSRRDGPFVLAFCRETLGAAERLRIGERVSLQPFERRFVNEKDKPYFQKIYWYLEQGWKNSPDGRPEVPRGSNASLYIPCFCPADWELVLAVSSSRSISFQVAINGTVIGQVKAQRRPDGYTVRVPGRLLFRGDNRLTLIAQPSMPGPRLHAVMVQQLLDE